MIRTLISYAGPYVSDYSKICLKRPLSKRPKIGFQDQLSLNAGEKYCRMLQRELSAILVTFIKLQSFIKIFVLSIFEWPLKTGVTVFISIIQEILHKCSCFIEFIKRVGEQRLNVRLAEHFISFSQQV